MPYSGDEVAQECAIYSTKKTAPVGALQRKLRSIARALGIADQTKLYSGRHTLGTADMRLGERYVSYQLIRNEPAAYSGDSSFCVMLDARRPNLLESWHAIMRCVRLAELRTRCKVLSWQVLSGALPRGLRKFLEVKYGIVMAGHRHGWALLPDPCLTGPQWRARLTAWCGRDLP